MADYLDGLNPEQRRAVETGDGPVVIIAGPGTGKTKTLTARIIHLIETGQAKPGEILALTFTKKAAEEMAQRVGRVEPTICTFHALCHKILGGELQFVAEPERLGIVKSLPRPAAYKGVSVRELALLISRAKNLAEENEALTKIVHAYNVALQERGLLDFDDLLLRTRDLLQNNPGNRPNHRFILVDEFQDTNRLQYQLLNLLRSNDNVFVIGDPNQSIYGFRGASGGIFNEFKADFPQATTITLTANYRSAPQIVRVSNAVFANAPALQPHSPKSGHARALELLNEYSEAHWVVGEIQRLIGGADLLQASSDEAKRGFNDFAILYRSRNAGLAVQKYLADSGLPYQVVGDGSPYDHPDVQALINLLRCAAGVPSPVHNFTPAQVAALLVKVDVTAPPSQLAGQLVEAFAIEPSPHIHHVIGTLVRFNTLQAAIDYFDTLAEQKFYDPTADAVTLLTIHAAKGLEFAHVFLVGAEEGLLPSAKGELQEEQRLFYVAVTRAKEQLDITYATRRGGQPAQSSQFITDLPADILPRQRDPNLAADKRRLQKRQAKRAQTSLF